jgi:hypothetical protein
MTHPGTNEENEFGDLDDRFKAIPKADAGIDPGDLLPEGVYKVVCSAQDLTGDGKPVDHEMITAKTGSKGFKLFFEVLEPETVKPKGSAEAVKTKGEIQEHIFYITGDNLPYVKRDLATILGRDLQSLTELKKITWAGLTCEIGTRHEVFRGFKNSKISFIAPWKPGADKKAIVQETKKTTQTDKTQEAAQTGGKKLDF